MREAISTADAPGAVGPYSQAIRAGGFVFCSGQVALRPDGTLVEGDVTVQTHQIMKNIAAVLAAAGLDYCDIVKTTIFLRTMDAFKAVNEAYGSYFEAAPPARSTVAVLGLPLNVDVEIEVTALAR